MRIINAEAVGELLSMKDCIGAMSKAMRAVSLEEVTMPPRLVLPLRGKGEYFFVMPVASERPDVYCAKLVGLLPGNPDQGRPTVQGVVVMFDQATGRPEAIVDGAAITTLRTAAASALATRHLARPDARSHGIFGAGVQAEAHLRAIAEVREIDEVMIWARSAEKAQAFVSRVEEDTGAEIRFTEDPSVAGGCDIISTVTGSSKVVLKGRWVKPGTHVNLVGAHAASAREADSELIVRSSVYVDSLESALHEAGDLLIPISEGVFGENQIMGEIGSVLAGTVSGRSTPDEVTIYKSLGLSAQDLFAAFAVLEKAQELNAGVEVQW